MTNLPNDSKTMDQRIAHLESEFSDMKQTLGGVVSTIGSQSESIQRIEGMLNRQADFAVASQRTPWGNILAGVALILSIGGLVSQTLRDDIERAERGVEALNQELKEHQLIEGHSGMQLRVGFLEAQVLALEGFKEEQIKRSLVSNTEQEARLNAAEREIQRLRDALGMSTGGD